MSWRQTREPRIADVLDAIAPKTPLLPLPSAKKADLKKWLGWMAARTPDEVPSVLAASAAASPQLERIAALARFEPDPRIGRFLITKLERYRPWSRSPKEQQLHLALFALVEKHADPEIVARLAKLSNKRLQDTGYVNSSAWFDQEIAALVKRLDVASTGDAALRERCDDWIAALRPKPVGTRAELFAAVYAAPEEDGPREVLADLLQREDEPHGELIALQLAQATGRGDPKIDARVKTLIREHGAACAPPEVFRALAAKSVRFERGFLAAGILRARSAKAFAAAIGAPGWATVHTLQPEYFAGWGQTASDGTRMLELLTHPVMRLRSVGPISIDEAALLVEHGVALPWTTLAIETRNARETAIPVVTRGSKVFANVEHLYLQISPDAFAALIEAPWVTRLKRLTFAGKVELPVEASLLGKIQIDRVESLRQLFGLSFR